MAQRSFQDPRDGADGERRAGPEVAGMPRARGPGGADTADTTAPRRPAEPPPRPGSGDARRRTGNADTGPDELPPGGLAAFAASFALLVLLALAVIGLG
jgi:hypothetical protein